MRFSARHNARSVRGSTLVERVGQLDLVTRERLVNRFGLERLRVRSGMGVNFRQPDGHPVENAEKCRGGHPPGFAETADVIGESNGVPVQSPAGGTAQAGEDVARQVAWRWLAHEAHEAKTMCVGNWNRQPQNGWVKVQVRVPVPIRRGETQRAKHFELPHNLGGQIRLERTPEEIAQAGLRRRSLELAARIREPRTFCREARAESQMEAHAQLRMFPGEACGFCGLRLIHHQTCLREQTGRVLKDDGFVDSRTAAKIVTGEDQGFQSRGHNLQEALSLRRINSADNS